MKVLRGIVNATLASRSREHVSDDYRFVGLGMDMFNWAYGTPPSFEVLDIDKINIKHKTPIVETDIKETTGQSYALFMKKFATESGLDMKHVGFSDSIAAKLTNESSDSFTSSIESRKNRLLWFSHLSTKVTGDLLSLDGDLTVLQQAVLPSLRAKLDDQYSEPRDILLFYGTHVVVKAYEGGMAEYFCRARESGRSTEEQFLRAAKAGFKAAGGSISGSVALTPEEQNLLHDVSCVSSLTIYGGEPSLARCLGNAAPSDCPGTGQSAWDEWAKSTKDAPAFMGIAADGLIPIWKLATKPYRQKQIEMAFKVRFAESFTPEIFYKKAEEKSQDPVSSVSLPPDYKMLSGGASVESYGKGVLLTASFPDLSARWVARAKDHKEADHSGTITAYVVGIYDPMDIWSVARFTEISERAAHPKVSAGNLFPYVMVGGGASVDYGSGVGNLLTESYPSGYSWVAASRDHLVSSPAKVTAYAIGLMSNLAGVKVSSYIEQKTSDYAAHPSTSSCTHYKFTGGGAKVNSEGLKFGNLLVQAFPENLLCFHASSKDHTKSDPTTINAYAIGVRVVLCHGKNIPLRICHPCDGCQPPTKDELFSKE